MNAAPRPAIAAENLSILRYIVLRLSESQGSTIGSTGLTPAGQGDLQAVFPRTSVMAAVTHAASVARKQHDEKVRARGVYHLFRLPVFWEAQLHRTGLERYSDADLASANTIDEFFGLLIELDDIPNHSPPPQGAVDLGCLELEDPKALATLAGTYRSALTAGQQVIPFFTLGRG